MPFQDDSIRAFCDALSARTPTPGGGSAAAIAGALGASLGAMVARFSGLDSLAAQLDPLRSQFLDLADRDARSYEEVRNAYALPKDTPEAKERRKGAIQSALLQAASVPLETLGCCVAAAGALADKRAQLSPKLQSDTISAGWMFRASGEAAAANVRINLEACQESTEKKILTHELEVNLSQLNKHFSRLNRAQI